MKPRKVFFLLCLFKGYTHSLLQGCVVAKCGKLYIELSERVVVNMSQSFNNFYLK